MTERVYDGTFELEWLAPDAVLRFEGGGAAVVTAPDGATTRIELGETFAVPVGASQRFDPDWVVAPGETLREVLEEKGFDADEWAGPKAGVPWLFGITHGQMRGLLDGDEPIDDELAAKLERLTSVSARMWLALERNYRVGLAAGKKRSC